MNVVIDPANDDRWTFQFLQDTCLISPQRYSIRWRDTLGDVIASGADAIDGVEHRE